MNKTTGGHIAEGTLFDWLEEELDPSARTSVEAHLDKCEECRAKLGEMREEEALLRGTLVWTADKRESLVSPRGVKTPSLAMESRLKPTRERQTPVWQAVAQKSLFRGGSERRNGQRGSLSRRTRAVAGIAGIAIAATFLLLIVQAGSRLPALDLFQRGPSVVVESVGAKPGETVYLSVRVENIEGPCGLVAKLRFDSKAIKILPSPSSSVSFAKVEGEEITIASLSKDGWKGEEGIAARIPVVLDSTARFQQEFNLNLDSVQLVGEQKKPLETKIRGGRIRVL